MRLYTFKAQALRPIRKYNTPLGFSALLVTG